MYSKYEVILKLILAVILGGIIGYEREFKNRPAGLRTHILVCLGAALVQIISFNFYFENKGVFNTDPMRLGAQVISGIGFLGAGTILKEGDNIKGLTTAASVWVVGCIGLAVGAGFYLSSVSATILSLIALKSYKIEEHISVMDKRFIIFEVTVDKIPGKLGEISKQLGKLDILVVNVEIKESDEERVVLELTLKMSCKMSNEDIMDKIVLVDGVKNIKVNL